jgi:hypothetical protein
MKMDAFRSAAQFLRTGWQSSHERQFRLVYQLPVETQLPQHIGKLSREQILSSPIDRVYWIKGYLHLTYQSASKAE